MKTNIARFLQYPIIIIVCVVYGIAIGKYEVFPFSVIKRIQDSFDGTKKSQSTPVILAEGNLIESISVTPKNLEDIRRQMNYIVFGDSVLPSTLPDTVFKTTDENYEGITNLRGLEQFEINQANQINSVGYIFYPKKTNNRLLIYHQGHMGDFLNGKETIKKIVAQGYTVYAFCMPLHGKNNKPIISLPKIGMVHLFSHERMKYLDRPIQYFITPVISMINYAEDKGFEDISMVGISGGGWTTTLVAAIDARISNSFPVAGTYPMFLRFQRPLKNYGDFEQTYAPLVKNVNYLDMYILGSVGEGRSQLQVLNKYDACCFDGEDYKKYESIIVDEVNKHAEGDFSCLLDTSHKEHKISEFTLSKILTHLGNKR